MANEIDLIQKNVKLLEILRLTEGMDKSSLAQKLDLTWPTISSYVDKLIEENIILKKDNIIQLNSSYGYFFGISIGSAQTKICITDMTLCKVSSSEFQEIIQGDGIFEDQKTYMMRNNSPITQYLYCQTPDNASDLSKNINSIFASIVKIIDTKALPLLGIGIAFTGAVNKINKRIIKAFNLNCLDGIDFEEGLLLRNYLDYFEIHGINISLENNSTAAVIAEKRFLYNSTLPGGQPNVNQKYCNCQNIISIYLGAGLGLGIIQNQHLYRGTNNLCGGVGHLEVPCYRPVPPASLSHTTCTCGGKNCLDHRLRTDVFETTFDDFRNWSSASIADYLKHNPESNLLMGQYLGYLINLLNNLLNPDLIIFTGKLYLAMDELWESIQRKRNENYLNYTKNNCALIKSQLGPTASAVGAAIGAYYDKFHCDVQWWHL